MSEAKCELCGEPMPAGEEMFKFHGYSGPCPRAPLPSKPTPPNTYAAGIEAAIRFVRKRSDDYIAEHGSVDPSTNTMEFPGNGDETVGEWEEIIDGLEALRAVAKVSP